MTALDLTDREKIQRLAALILSGWVERGLVDTEDEAAMRAAEPQAKADAKTAYLAVLAHNVV